MFLSYVDVDKNLQLPYFLFTNLSEKLVKLSFYLIGLLFYKHLSYRLFVRLS